MEKTATILLASIHLFFFGLSAQSRPSHLTPHPSSRVFDVMTFGAFGDAKTDDTNAFKAAWKAACSVESAILLVPAGRSFLILPTTFTGPCKNGLTFQLEGALIAPDGPNSWPGKMKKRVWLVFYGVDGMALEGSGLIDGRGEKWWRLPCRNQNAKNRTTMQDSCDRPVTMQLDKSSNLIVRGIKVQNSPQFHLVFDDCTNIIVDSIIVESPPDSPNTDGIHIGRTEAVSIYNSVISNGDDCVSIGSGSSHVLITNVTCSFGHGISIGSLGSHNSHACVTNITVSDTTIKHSDNGVRIKTWQGGDGVVRSVSFRDVHVDNVRNPIIIDQYYCPSSVCANQSSAVSVSDVSYVRIKGTYDERSPPIHFGCSDDIPCTNLTLSEIELRPAHGDVTSHPFCWNAYGDTQTVTLPPIYCLLEGPSQKDIVLENEKC